jgi:hypothetical protein
MVETWLDDPRNRVQAGGDVLQTVSSAQEIMWRH